MKLTSVKLFSAVEAIPLMFWTHYCVFMLGKCKFLLPCWNPEVYTWCLTITMLSRLIFTVLQSCPSGSFFVQVKVLSNAQQFLCFKTILTIFKTYLANACLMCLLEISRWFHASQRNLLKNLFFLIILLS